MKKKLRPFAIILIIALAVILTPKFIGKMIDILGNEAETEVQNNVQSFLATTTYDTSPITELGKGNFPDTLAGLEAETKKTFNISTYQDWLNLQKLSEESSLEGYTFIIDANTTKVPSENIYELNRLTGFTGIGTEAYPFKGTLKCYSVNGVSYRIKYPIFAYLSGGATVQHISIESINSCAGLAGKLVGSGTLSLSNIFVCGEITNTTGAAGGLFAEMDNSGSDVPLEFKVTIDNQNNTGIALGTAVNDSTGKTSLSVNGLYSGSIAGKITGNVVFEYDDSVISINNVTIIGSNTKGSNGYIIGYMKGTDSYIPEFRIVRDCAIRPVFDASSKGSAGGVIGSVEKGIIDTAGHTLTVESSIVDGSGNRGKKDNVDICGQIGGSSGGVGGVAGVFIKSEVADNSIIHVQDIYISINIGSYAEGGIFGYVLDSDLGSTTEDGKGFIIKNIKVSKYGNAAKNSGGIIGLYETTVNSNIENTISYCKVYDSYVQSQTGPAGGIIGHIILEGKGNLTITNWNVAGCVITAATVAGNQAGTAVIGRIESTASTDAVVKILHGAYQRAKFGNRAIYLENYLRMWDDNSEVAGIVGVSVNANIEMDDITIDAIELVSKSYCAGVVAKIDNPYSPKYTYIRKLTIKGNVSLVKSEINPAIGFIVAYVGKNVSLALDGEISIENSKWTNSRASYYGQIAGINEGSLIFLDEGATFKPYKNTLSTYLRNIDEVGNYGGMFRNGTWGESKVFKSKDVNPVNGSVTKTSDGKAYIIANEGDLLRLAAVFNTEGCFGLEAFGADVTYADLLNAEYHLTDNEYDMTSTGLVSMQRNIGSGSNLTADVACFTGKFIGNASGKSKIINNVSLYRQWNFGFFVFADSAEFSNLHMDVSFEQLPDTNGNGYYEVANMGGLATFAVGNIDVTNCIFEADMKTCYNEADTRGYLGGLFGRYQNSSNSILNVENVEASGTKSIYDKDNYTSQLIGYADCSKAAALPQINFKNITISGSILGGKSGESSNVYGGLIALVNNGTGDMWVTKENADVNVKISVEDLTIDGLNVTSAGVTDPEEEIAKSSGLIGYAWTDMDASFENVKVQNSILNADRLFGGFITEATGKISFESINISNLNVNASNQGAAYHSGLLIAEGKVLYCSVKDYVIDGSSTVVSGVNKDYFDEIVGISVNSEADGGVVSVSYSDTYKSLDTGNYKRYKNQAKYDGFDAADISNAYTRYYYDIPEILESGIVLADGIISSPEELMDWHLINYAHNDIKSYFVTDNGKTYSEIVETDYTINGTIDLNGYSYYPTGISGTGITGTNDAKIVFYAQDINNCEAAYGTGKKETFASDRQHYLLHSGLFYDIAASDISNLTLTGTVSKSKSGSGGLCVGKIYGVPAESEADIAKGNRYSTDAAHKTIFDNIILDNLWVSGTDSMNGYYGLMIHNIYAGAKVEFNRIKMVNYQSNTPTVCDKAAAALIGLVGSENGDTNSDIVEINVKFTNMDIADVADTTTLTASSDDLKNSTAADKVLAHASFIYEFRYYEDTCSGLYTFYQADYLVGKGNISDVSQGADMTKDASAGYITMGYEIRDTVEFYDNKLIVPISRFPDAETPENEYGFDYNNYKPYVYNYTQREIFVNPKPGNITEGCGTYEDPYVIDSPRQLKSLYYYLKDNLSLIMNWKVNKIGDDTSFCNGQHTENDLQNISDPNAEFPTRSEMNQAYYLIKNKIDLSDFEEFSGFGSQAEPFIGVFIGEKDGNGKNPVISLPNQTANNVELDSFAFIKYAKGCVVKDIDFELGSNEADYIKVKNAGAGVIAYVLGGDNIIDNVSVDGTLKLGVDITEANIGGYAGQVRLGTLIIRNLKTANLNDFRVAVNTGLVTDVTIYPWIGGIIGNVVDGAVFYEGYSDNSFPVFNDTNISGIYTNASSLAAAPNYSIINSGYIEAAGKIGRKFDTQTGLNLTINNDAGLMMIAAAIANGTLTYESREEVKAGYPIGYNSESRCRNGDYSFVGNVGSKLNEKYIEVIENDNLNGRQKSGADFYSPYILNFVENFNMGILFPVANPVYNMEDLQSSYISMPANLFTITMAQNYIYDMSKYKNTFRGIGSASGITNNCFKGNINGNSSTVKIDYVADKKITAVNAGFLNCVRVDSQTDYCYIKNITIQGTVINSTESVENLSDMNDISGDSIAGINAAGLMGMLVLADDSLGNFTKPYNYYFENVDINNLEVGSLENSAGLVARVSGNNTALGFVDCDIDGLNTTSLADAAGLVASYQDAIGLTINNCSVKNATLNALGIYSLKINDEDKKLFPSAGGYAGRAVATDKTISITGGTLSNLDISAKGHCGGLIGQTAGTIEVNESGGTAATTINVLKMTGLGTLDYQQIKKGVDYDYREADADNRSRFLGSFGGCIGFAGEPATFKNITVTNIDINIPVGVSTDSVAGQEDNGNARYYPQTYAGGIVGIMYKGGTVSNCTVGSNDGYVKIIGDSGYTYETDASKKVSTATDNANANVGKKNNRVGVGGFIGAAGNINGSSDGSTTNTDVILFDGCGLYGSSSSDSILSGCYAGGLIGINRSKSRYNVTHNFNNCNVENVTIQSITRSGGMIAYTSYSNSYIQKFNNAVVSGCIINNLPIYENNTGIISGGILGDTPNLNEVYNSTVKDCVIGGVYSYNTGGVSGLNYGENGIVKVRNSVIENNTIMGCRTGGIAGYMGKNKSGTGMLDETTIKNNKIIGFFNTEKSDNSRKVYVGGAYGYAYTSNNPLYGSLITLENNLIAGVHLSSTYYSNTYVGGFAGYYNDKVYINNFELNNNIIGMLDNTKFSADTTISDKENYIIQDTHYDIWDESGNVAAGKITDYIGIFDYSESSPVITEFPNEIKESDLCKYASYIGLFTGTNSTNPAYFTGVGVNYSEGLKKFRPAADVGYNGKAASNDVIYGYRRYYHIVYPGQFENIETIVDNYNNQKESFAAINYRLQYNYKQADTFSNVLSNTYKDNSGYLTPFKNDSGDPIVKLAVFDNSDLDMVINTYVNLLTNNGGTLSNNGEQTGIIGVSAVKYRVTNGVVTEDTGYPSVKVSNAAAGEYSVTGQKTVTFTVNHLGYDYATDNQNGTYTVLKIDYAWNNNTVKHTVEIPVFIEKMLEIDTHIVGVSGRQYDMDKILSDGSSSMSILRGVYTAYVEYNYNDAIEKYANKLEKELRFLDMYGNPVDINKDTKITLIDLNNNKVYYYKASENKIVVALSDFKNTDGESYQEPKLQELTLLSDSDKEKSLHYTHYDDGETGFTGLPYNPEEKVAMQKYLLIIDTSETGQIGESGSRNYYVNLKPKTDEATKKFLDRKCRYPIDPECTLNITEIKGIEGKFVPSDTEISGSVSENGELKAAIKYELTANQSFWNNKISSSGMLEEYIDIAIYLVDKNGIRTALPAGTKVTFNKGMENESLTSTSGESILYFYKDSGNVNSTKDINENTTFSGTIDFDFSHADFSDFEEGEYTVRMELLKTTEKDFPVGGELLDTREYTFTTKTERNLGFVLETEDLMSLGMNGYLPETSDSGNVNYSAKIDFTEYIPKSDSSNQTDLEELAEKYFTIRYGVYRKVKNENDTYSYIPYIGENVKLYYNDEIISSGSGVTFRLSMEEIKKLENYVFEIPFKLEANVNELLKSNDYITNYKVVGQLFISDTALDGTTELDKDSGVKIINIDKTKQPDVSLNDFFIFTIAKIKTDLSM